MNADELTRYYRGFWLTEARGNNAFSFSRRRQRRIYVPPVAQDGPEALTPGSEIVFSEIEDGKERNLTGLANFLVFERQGKTFFVIDNHNHAFFFWNWGLKTGRMPRGAALVHVDQHTDMRAPDSLFPAENAGDLQAAFEYTNFTLNVGNFIQPALQAGLFSGVDIVDSSAAFEKPLPEGYVLDIDVDIFSREMSYIDADFKTERIRGYIDRADFITIATSPFFIDQPRAIDVVGQLLAA